MFLLVCLLACLFVGLFARSLACLLACVRAVVLSMVQCHGESNAAVAERGLKAIVIFATDNAANRTKLGEGGACTGACSIKFVRVCELDFLQALYVRGSMRASVLEAVCLVVRLPCRYLFACVCACSCVVDSPVSRRVERSRGRARTVGDSKSRCR